MWKNVAVSGLAKVEREHNNKIEIRMKEKVENVTKLIGYLFAMMSLLLFGHGKKINNFFFCISGLKTNIWKL